MVLKIREGGTVQRRALYLALGVTLDGDRDVLGMWFQETEGAKFWMQVLTDLKPAASGHLSQRDGLTGSRRDRAISPTTGTARHLTGGLRRPRRARVEKRWRDRTWAPEGPIWLRRERYEFVVVRVMRGSACLNDDCTPVRSRGLPRNAR